MKKKIVFLLLPWLLTSCQIRPASPSSVSSETSMSVISTVEDESTSYEEISTEEPVNNKENNTFYQLLVYSFADGDGDGIGDFKGIVDKLDYLSDLGITGIWLSPVHPSPTYHSYDVIDYEAIRSLYEVTSNGVTYDFNYLIKKAHEKNIKIIMDMVLNHTSNQHSWYSNHKDYYQSENYFGSNMPELDYNNETVKSEIKRICSSYLDKGVDGFRLDAAYWIYNSGSDRDSKNFSWWNEFVSAMKQKKEDVYIIGEVLDDDRNICERYNQAGFDTFDFTKADIIDEVINDNKGNQWAKHLEEYQTAIRSYRSDALEGNVLSNHDIGRFTGEVATKEGIIFGNALNILAPGTSYIYYGDELGLVGTCPQGYTDMNYRTPMPFGSERTDSCKYFMNFRGNGVTTSTSYSSKTAEEDQKDSESIYSYVKKAIAIKQSDKTFGSGKVTSITTPISSLGAYSISLTESYSILFNASASTTKCTLNEAPSLKYELSPYNNISINEKEIVLPAYSIAILDNDTITVETAEGENNTLPTPLDDESEVKEEKDGRLIFHYYNENNWNDVYCYTWVNNNQYFGGWPGSKMTKEDGDWYTITLEHGASNVIFTNNNSSQTDNLHRNSEGEYYFYRSHWYNVNPIS